MTAPGKQFKTVDEYISSFPDSVQDALQQLRRTVTSAAPEAEEIMSYQIPTFKLNGNLVHFAAFKRHIGFYPTPSAIEAFREELAPYEVAKGSVRFPLNQPIPFNLVTRITEYRVRENLEKR